MRKHGLILNEYMIYDFFQITEKGTFEEGIVARLLRELDTEVRGLSSCSDRDHFIVIFALRCQWKNFQSSVASPGSIRVFR